MLTLFSETLSSSSVWAASTIAYLHLSDDSTDTAKHPLSVLQLSSDQHQDGRYHSLEHN